MITCNECKAYFEVTPSDICVLKDNDIEVQFFSCPHCFKKYQVLTTDSEMRKLIEQRKRLSKKVNVGKSKGFDEHYFKKMMKELNTLKEKQKKLAKSLWKIGEEILNGRQAVVESEKNEGQGYDTEGTE